MNNSQNTNKSASDTPNCPNCGNLMLLQTAHKGHFAGHKFYGCANWRTTCKGVIVNYDDAGQLQSDDGSQINTQSAFSRPPVSLRARERFENFNSLFFQNMTVPKEILDMMNKGEINREDLSRYGQWRLDFSVINEFDVNEDIKRVLLIVKKILTRGRVTLLSPKLEEKIRKLFLIKEFDPSNIDLNIYLTIAKPNNKTTTWFDGIKRPELGGLTFEHYFYERILSKYLGPYYKRFILPQVNFSSLIDGDIDDSIGYQRPDFLITTPTKSIIVELDDSGHEEHLSRDLKRNQVLQQNGFYTIRIENKEIENESGINIENLKEILREDDVKIIKNISLSGKYLLAVKLAHQIQIVLMESLIAGIIPIDSKNQEIYFDVNSVSFSKEQIEAIINYVMEDLKELMSSLCTLYGVDSIYNSLNLKILNRLESVSSPVITFNENLVTNGTLIIVQDISFPRIISHYEERTTITPITDISEDNLCFFLKYIFRYDTFLDGQFDAIARSLQGKDSVILLPTGAGKSLAFQLASLVLPGVTIIIDPTTALIDDQIDNLLRKGIDRVVGITSLVKTEEKSKLIDFFAQGEYIFCYIAPQRLQNQKFRDKIVALTTNTPISLIAIDEAHCVSEWGHNFMTAYLNIGRITREYCESQGRIPPLLALTGTASNAVLRDVQRELQIKFDAIITPKEGFNRKELSFAVFECRSSEKQSKLQSIFKRYLPEDPIFSKMKFYKSFDRLYDSNSKDPNGGLVFCLNAKGSFGVLEVKRAFSTLGIDVRIYSGGKPDKSFSDIQWNKDKRQNATDFKNNKFPVMVATKSFGMGIDKPNIRYVIHFGLPQSIESFYQEVGRAGRDRKNAQSVLLLSNDFKERTNKLLDPDATTDILNQIMRDERNWDNDDDISRAIFLHLRSFRGVKEEIKSIIQVQDSIGNLEIANKILIVFNDGNREDFEKAIHRLLLLGVVKDYTIDYATNEFSITITGISKNLIIESFCKYIEGYNRGRVVLEKEKILPYINLPFSEFVQHAAELLITFIYETIEKGRRRAFREMLSMSERAVSEANNQDNLIRDGILRYLETTYSEEIQHVLDETETFNNLKRILDGSVESEMGEMIGGIKSPRDAAEIRGQVSRYLESSPDHPGLLFLRAISEIYCSNYDSEIALQNIKAAYNSAIGKYNISKSVLYDTLTWILEKIYNLNKELVYEDYIFQLNEIIEDPDFIKTIMNYPNMDEKMLYVPMLYSLNKQTRRAITILTSK